MTSTSSSVDADGNANANANANVNVNVNVITPEDVLESLMNDGTIDAIRLKIISQLKANEELKNNTISMVEQSKVLNTPGAEKQTKRELFDALRHELETPALERASKAVWELILDNDGLGKEINQTVQNVFCRLSGLQPPLLPPPSDPHQLKEIKKNKDKETDHSHSPSPSKKRTSSEMSPQTGQVEAPRHSPHPPSLPLDSVADSRKAGDQSRSHMEEDDEPWRCKRTDGKQWRCKDDRAPNQKFCERHMYKGKKPRKQMDNSNQGTSSSNNMVDPAPPNITTSTPSQLVAAGNTSLSPGSSSKTDTQ